jgi:hypothetical protein
VHSLAFWEYVEDVATAVVLIGVIGEYIADFTEWGLTQKRLGKVFTLILIAGIAGELLAVVRTQQLSNREIAALHEVADRERLDRLKLALDTANRDVASMLHENRWGGIEEHERMLQRRDELQKSLTASGIDAATAQRTAERITRLVDWDLRKAIAANVLAAWHPIGSEDPTDSSRRSVFQARIEAVIQEPDRLAALDQIEKLVKREPHITWYEQIETSMRLYEGYLTSGRLPKIGRADDMNRAPIH